jgi:hypothetical protein
LRWNWGKKLRWSIFHNTWGDGGHIWRDFMQNINVNITQSTPFSIEVWISCLIVNDQISIHVMWCDAHSILRNEVNIKLKRKNNLFKLLILPKSLATKKNKKSCVIMNKTTKTPKFEYENTLTWRATKFALGRI